ncbi:hypothetical protein KP509_22G043300 [Ceratopteris richardii]|nr:hypothetical protein KP509_22G043300 [Ceratopteris richardii]
MSHRKLKRWVELESKDFQFDVRGDRENLVYGSLYRKHVPLFYRHQIRIYSNNQVKPFRFLESVEGDGGVVDEKSRECRYWSAKFASLERRKDFCKLKILVHAQKSRSKRPFQSPENDFISLEELDVQEELRAIGTLQEESWDGYVTRKTREFNELTRERPHDESLWIAFVNFQDELIKAATKKAAAQQAVEKKIAILEKALEIHPSSEDLWLLLLETCRSKDLASTLLNKWEDAIRCIPQSYRLWRGYIKFKLGDFSLFTVQSVRKSYVQAIQIYSAAHSLKAKDGIEDARRVEIERNLLLFFMDLCRFEWQTGHHELAVGLLQALIEYNLFAPPLEMSEKSKKRLFRDFWDIGAARVGENGATGWAAWLQKEEEWIKKAFAKDEAEASKGDESETGGWTGWYTPLVNKDGEGDEKKHAIDDEIFQDNTGTEAQQTDGDEDAEDRVSEANEEDEIILLERLGLNLKAEDDVEVKDSTTWKHWFEKEKIRDSEQWLPVRLKNLKATHSEEISPGIGSEEELERAVLFDDINECLFSLTTMDAQLDLIFHFTDFCSGPYPQWCCSNCSKWMEKIEGLEELYEPFLGELRRSCTFHEPDFQNGGYLEELVGGAEWIHECQGRSDFLVNALLLLRPFFCHSIWLEEKLLNVEDSRYNIANESKGGFGPRILAKRLLKGDRQAIVLLGAYACAEASAGNLDLARKVFDTTLASLASLPMDRQSYGPLVYERYVEMELQSMPKAAQKEAIFQKVLYILSCLGSSCSYTPFRGDRAVTAIDLLKARRGFKEQIQSFRKERKQPESSDSFKSLVVCASILELLTDGLDAAVSVFKESFSLCLPGKQQQSMQFEFLNVKYINMLEENKGSVRPAALRHTILQSLSQYPNNPHLLAAYVRCNSQNACRNGLRRFFDDALQRNPTTLLYLFAISIEIGRQGSSPRIHSLFEKAVQSNATQQSVILWRFYIAYELQLRNDVDAARRVYFRAIHACPWSKLLWMDGFSKMSTVLSAKELTEFQDIMREKELRIRTDVYEILLEEEAEGHSL